MQRAFVIRPFGKKKDPSGVEIDFERVHNELILPALKDAGLGGGTTGEIVEAGNIREDMFSLIIEADLVVCDITVHNANVFYELGIRHALRKKRSILIRGTPAADAPPFDVLTDRYLAYLVIDPAAARAALAESIRATLASERETDSPVFKMLPALREVDAATVQVIRTDCAEEIARAHAAGSAGWLRLLAQEVAGQRFQWPALRSIGQAQWALKDFDGARTTWEAVRANDPDDVGANLSLANLYERIYKREKKPEFLELSNQAIARILNSDKPDADQRTEALALGARNQKTLWRLDWEALEGVPARRAAATSRTLRKPYEAYRKAYLFDLNHHWSGLAALQQGTVMLELANDERWEDTFDDADESRGYKDTLKRQMDLLRPAVTQAIEGALARMANDDKDRVWAEISKADLMFLTETRAPRVIEAYKSAVPKDNAFAWDAARGQLDLFAKLGIRAEIANEVIQTLDRLVVGSKPAGGDLHAVIFAGHRIDDARRAERRFPQDKENQARELIKGALLKAKQGWPQMRVLASAAPGSDILCHELCVELGIDSTVCLPMPKDAYARVIFGDLFGWRSRYLELIGRQSPLQLSDQEGLPRWLQSSGLDPWERGNLWVMEMARSSGAKKVSLIALWDGQPTGSERGGTAHMVTIARDAGTIDMVLIDAKQLVS
jgi:hypothetical protein